MTSYGRPLLPNLFNLSDTDHADDYFDITAKTRVLPTINGTTGIFVTIGQSKIANNSSAPAVQYIVTHGANCINLNPYDGQYYIANDPVLGCSASTGFLQSGWQGRLCDKLITAGKYTQVILVPLAIAGSSVTDWDTGGAYHDRIRAVSALLTAKGIAPTSWLWQQGTTDNQSGMTQATYQTTLRSVIAYARSLPGRSADKWTIAQDTILNNVTSTGIRAAQAAVATDTGNKLGPDMDTLTMPTYTDGTHFNTTGNDAAAGLWSTNIQGNF